MKMNAADEEFINECLAREKEIVARLDARLAAEALRAICGEEIFQVLDAIARDQ
jgi:hypothetical protein